MVEGPELHCATCGGPVRPSARFCETCGAALSSRERDRRPVRPVPRSDELRPVTALFADIVGSTSLSERLRPDEVKALIGECVSRMSRAAEEFGGMIQSIQGD